MIRLVLQKVNCLFNYLSCLVLLQVILQMNNDAAHKKIILDTNGNTITNSSGSPLTTNSSTTLELKGSGNVQSTLKTFTSSGSADTTISEADNSTVAVANDHYILTTRLTLHIDAQDRVLGFRF